MAATLKLEIITLESKAYSADVEWVTLPCVQGELGVYPQHVPLMTQIVPGEVVAHTGTEDVVLAVGQGVVEITPNRVSILTVMAARADDETQLQEARRRAEERLKERISDKEIAAVNAAVTRSIALAKIKRRQK
jgi:F-type H+-transporting ATPase subunit epsilon